MDYDSPRALRTSLEQRLKNRASADGVLDVAHLQRLRKRVAFERFLARLKAVAPGEWVLKGGFALEVRLGEIARTTKDIDIDWTLLEEEALELIRRAAAHDAGDFFRFRIERSEPLVEEDEGQGQRWRLTAELDGREFETVLVDVETEADPVVEPTELTLPTALDFAGHGAIEIPVLQLEQQTAEKVHAYTRLYGAKKRRSSRVKDLVDIALVATTLGVDAATLRSALVDVFERRGTHPLPASLPAPPADWRRGWREITVALPVPDDLDEGHGVAAKLLDPVLSGRDQGRWSPDRLEWVEP